MYKEHREKLYDALNGDCAALRGGLSSERYNTDRDMPFRQEGMFYYFTGCEEPDCCALFDGAARKAYLFVPKLGQEHALWYGYVETLEQKQGKYGDQIEIRYTDEFKKMLAELGSRTVHVIRDVPGIPNVEAAKIVDDMMLIGGELRLIKD